eukprot:TRINITY_DN12371_c0_g1_i13.p1 TRINITY_DN12371_c0_g1~~TRINITY_DN12371_c0_g1_i13.p1  ORF type:complete len:240 (+),score=15.99 TRINITY_DN12371_c0_g1_i13:2287-3006(+)
MRALLEAGASANKSYSWVGARLTNATPMSVAAECNNVSGMRLLLTYRASVEAPDFTHVAPLYEACEKTNIEAAALLLDNGADPNPRQDLTLWSPLTRAVNQKSQTLVTMLLQAGADPNDQKSISMNTPLHEAIIGDDPELTKVLLDAHANPNIVFRPARNHAVGPMHTPRTSVHVLLRSHHLQHYIPLLELMLDAGADPLIKFDVESRSLYKRRYFKLLSKMQGSAWTFKAAPTMLKSR